mgnify:FL=1
MYCSECGKKLKPGAKFCSGCGAKVAGMKTGADTVSKDEIMSEPQKSQKTDGKENLKTEEKNVLKRILGAKENFITKEKRDLKTERKSETEARATQDAKTVSEEKAIQGEKRKKENGVMDEKKTVLKVKEVPGMEADSEKAEKVEPEHGYQKFEIEGRRSGAYFLKERPLTEILVHGEQVDVQINSIWLKKKYTFMKADVLTAECKRRPIIYLRDILCLLVLLMFAPLTNWQTIWGMLLDVKLMFGRCIMIMLADGTNIKIPVGRYFDALNFLKKIGYEESVPLDPQLSFEEQLERQVKGDSRESFLNFAFFIFAVLMIRSGMGKESVVFMAEKAFGSISQVETVDRTAEADAVKKVYVTIVNHTGREIQSLCARSPEKNGIWWRYECIDSEKSLHADEECIVALKMDKGKAAWEFEETDSDGVMTRYENITFSGCDTEDVKLEFLPECSESGEGTFEVSDRKSEEERNAQVDYEDVTESELLLNKEAYDGKKVRLATVTFYKFDELTTEEGIGILCHGEIYDKDGEKYEDILSSEEGYVEGTFIVRQETTSETGEVDCCVDADRIVLTRTSGDMYHEVLDGYGEGETEG